MNEEGDTDPGEEEIEQAEEGDTDPGEEEIEQAEEGDTDQNGRREESPSFLGSLFPKHWLETLVIVSTPVILFTIAVITVLPLPLPGQEEQILGYTALLLLILYLVIIMILFLWYIFNNSLYSEKLSEYLKDSVEFRRNIITRILTIFLPVVLVTIAFLSPFGQGDPTVLMSVAIGLLGVYLWTAHMFIEADIEEIKGEVNYVKEFMDGKTEAIREKKDWYGRFKSEIENANGTIKVTQHSPIRPSEAQIENWEESFETLRRNINDQNITVEWIISGASEAKLDYIEDTIDCINGRQNVVIYGSIPIDKVMQSDSFPEDLPIARTQSFQIFKEWDEISKGDVVMGIHMGTGRREYLVEGSAHPDFVTRDVVLMKEFDTYFDNYKQNCMPLYAKGEKQDDNFERMEELVSGYVLDD